MTVPSLHPEIEAALGRYSQSQKTRTGYGSAASESRHDKELKALLPGSTPRLRNLLKKKARQKIGLE